MFWATQRLTMPSSFQLFMGVILRFMGHHTGDPLLGAKVVAAMLMFATVSGILMSLFLNTTGGAWDNAKKFIETGALGGKGSDCHKAAVTRDTVGDPLKDTATAGPSLHVLIKMLATITYDPSTGIYGMDCYVVLERAGYPVSRRRHCRPSAQGDEGGHNEVVPS